MVLEHFQLTVWDWVGSDRKFQVRFMIEIQVELGIYTVMWLCKSFESESSWKEWLAG
jgi:hypothetical protein